MKPDPRRTADAVSQVRAVYPNATQLYTKESAYVIRATWAGGDNTILGSGTTPKEAWWNAVPKALAKALTQ